MFDIERLRAAIDHARAMNEYVTIRPDAVAELADELERLQRVLDSRPAINAALPDSYIKWSQSIYTMEYAHASRAPKQ